MEALKKKVKKLEDVIQKIIAAAEIAIPTTAQTHEVTTPGAPSAAHVQGTTPGAPVPSPEALATDNYDERKEFNDHLRPLFHKGFGSPPGVQRIQERIFGVA